MPNWVSNSVEFKGKSQADIDAIMKFMKSVESESGYENVFDFNNVIPMPKALNGRDDCGAPVDKSSDWQQINKKVYGYYDWSDWSIDYWGTKWNSCNGEVDDGAITFDTAWAVPFPVYSVLSQLFPDVELCIHCCEETGAFEFDACIQNGKYTYFYDIKNEHMASAKELDMMSTIDLKVKTK